MFDRDTFDKTLVFAVYDYDRCMKLIVITCQIE